MMLTDTIASLDYCVLRKKNKLKIILLHFRIDKQLLIKNILTEFTFLRIAIREDSKQLLLQGKREIVTSDCPKVNETLNRIVDCSTAVLTYLDQQITHLNDEFENRYNWDNVKKTLNDYQTNYTTLSLDDYLQKKIETL